MKTSKQTIGTNWSTSTCAGPDDSPGFRFWRDFLDWQRQLNALLKPLGLTQPQFAILAVCGWLTRQGQSITQHGIATFTSMDRMHISQIVSRLEKAGLLTKQTCPNDQRVNQVSLSAKGRHQLSVAMPIVETFDKEFFQRQDV